MERQATAIWMGGLKGGKGTIATQSNALSGAPYAFSTRFENDRHGTNPEELIAAAHAACYSMALSAELEREGISPEEIQTTARVSIGKEQDGWRIYRSALETQVRARDADEGKFQAAAQSAKQNCPVSKLLTAEISLSASLERGDSRSMAANI